MPNSPCEDIDCSENGSCVVTGTSEPLCICDQGYHNVGNDCLAATNACSNVDCGNNSSCVVTAANEALCICNQGYRRVDEACIEDACAQVTCSNQGSCVVTAANEALCICNQGYRRVGQACIEDACAQVTCSNHGSCVVTAANEALCICNQGYRRVGQACIEDACAQVTCSNQGSCVVTSANEALCICNQGYDWDGQGCTATTNPCSSVDCGSNSSCLITATNEAMCVCNQGYDWDGHACVSPTDPCSGITCSGYGSCVVTALNQPLCICIEGYRPVGGNCVPVDGCSASTICNNGWCLLPACTFEMGSPSDEGCRWANEGPVHPVTITRPFLMKQTEVTQGEWKAIFSNNPSYNTACGDDCPVEQVNWFDTVAYANALSADEGFQPCYQLSNCSGTPGGGNYSCNVTFVGLLCTGYRLPTEAEWEYAARAGTTTAYWIGSNVGHNGEPVCDAGNPFGIGLPDIAWYGYNSGSKSQPVAQKLPNHWGLYDVHGNVSEWVNDWYSTTYYSMCEQGCSDPVGPSTGSSRANRGGNLSSGAGLLRSAFRHGNTPIGRQPNLGFRLARSLP